MQSASKIKRRFKRGAILRVAPKSGFQYQYGADKIRVDSVATNMDTKVQYVVFRVVGKPNMYLISTAVMTGLVQSEELVFD